MKNNNCSTSATKPVDKNKANGKGNGHKRVGNGNGETIIADTSTENHRNGQTGRNDGGVLPRPTPSIPDMCRYQGAKVFRHCSLFGDPHLRTFQEEFQTCKVEGAWPLINNEYLAVQVTNVPVEGNEDATATSKVSST